MKTKKKAATSDHYIREVREAVQGFACPCIACEAEDVRTNRMFCAGCGHGFLDLRRGGPDDAKMGCSKCGSRGAWLDAKPALPEPPKREYRVQLERTIRQSAELICSEISPARALALARDYANDGIPWIDNPDDIGVMGPLTMIPISVIEEAAPVDARPTSDTDTPPIGSAT